MNSHKLLYKVTWTMSQLSHTYKVFYGLDDINRIKHRDFVLHDSTKMNIEIMRQVARRLAIAPVCLTRSSSCIRVYGEDERLKVFARVYNAIEEYRTNNPLRRISTVNVKESQINTFYKKNRKVLYEWLQDNQPEYNLQKEQYLYSLYLYVAKMEKLIPKKWGSKQEENMGYHYVTKTFYNKRILG